MYSQIIRYTGNGSVQEFDVLFDAAAVFVVPAASGDITYHAPTMWCGRSNNFGASESIRNGVRILGRKLLVGDSAQANTSGVAYTALLIGAENGDIETPSWCGNAAAGREIKLAASATPILTLTKRDSARAMVCKVAGSPTVALNGSAVADSISLAAGKLVLGSAPEVNEYDSATEIGEGIDGFVAYSASGIVVGSYVGTGSAQTVAIGCNAAAVIVFSPSESTPGRMFIPGATGGLVKPISAGSLSSGGTVLNGRLQLNGSMVSTSGVTYRYIAIPLRTPSIPMPVKARPKLVGKKALFLTGRGTIGYVDCGTGLNINGPVTLEWWGDIPGDVTSGASIDGWLIGKAACAQGATAGGASWGMSAVSRIGGGFSWSGPHATAVVNGRVNYDYPLDTASWRTGVVVPNGVHHHAYVYLGNGASEYYLDGVRVKQIIRATDSIVSNAAHRITMGARYTGSAYSNNSRMLIMGSGVYSRALSASEIKARYEIALMGSAQTDVTTGLAERWDGSALSGASWSAQVSAANNGSIVGGTILTL